MEFIKYQLLQSVSKCGAPITLEVKLSYSEENLEIAKKEAYNGEYHIVEENGEVA